MITKLSNILNLPVAGSSGQHGLEIDIHETCVEPTTHNINQFLSAFEQDNWMHSRAAIAQNQPNLSRVFAALDFLLPRQANQSSSFLGITVKSHHIQDEHSPQSIWINKNAQINISDNYIFQTEKTSPTLLQRVLPGLKRAPNLTQSAISLEIEQRAKTLLEWDSGPEGLVQRQTDWDGFVQMPRDKTIQLIVSLMLPQVTTNTTLIQNHTGHIDFSLQTTNALLEKILPAPVDLSQQDPNLAQQWYSILLDTLIHTDGEQSSPTSDLTQQQLLNLLQQHPDVIDLVNLIDWAMLPGAKTTQDQTEYPVHTEDSLSDWVEHAIKTTNPGNNNYYLPTLVPGLSRHVKATLPYCCPKTIPDQPFWLYQTQSIRREFNTKVEAMSYLLELATIHFNQAKIGNPTFSNDLLPFAVYQVVSRLTGLPVPALLQTAHQQRMQTIQAHRDLKQQAIQQQVEEKRQRAIIRAKERIKTEQLITNEAARLGVEADQDILLLASMGSSPAIAERTFDIQVLLNLNQTAELKKTLEGQHFIWMDMAHNRRGYAAVAAVKNNPNNAGGFFRDNQCWNRATWLSVFEQINSAQDLNQRIEASNISAQKTKTRVQHLIVAMFTGYSTYERSRLEFLHQGEEADMGAQPAHFRTGQTIENFCAEFGLPEIEMPQQTNLIQSSAVEYYIESELKTAVFVLASGIRSTLKELKQLNGFGSLGMATSDIPAAVHRALGLTALIVESKEQNQPASLRMVGPANHPLNDFLNRLPKNAEGMPIFKLGQIADILVNTKVPVIHLQGSPHNDGHYTVYLPSQSVLGKQLAAEHHRTYKFQQTKPYISDQTNNQQVPRQQAAQPSSLANPLTRQKSNSSTPLLGSKQKSVIDRMKIDDKPIAVDKHIPLAEYQQIEFPSSDSDDFYLLSTREADRQDPLAVVKKAFEYPD